MAYLLISLLLVGSALTDRPPINNGRYNPPGPQSSSNNFGFGGSNHQQGNTQNFGRAPTGSLSSSVGNSFNQVSEEFRDSNQEGYANVNPNPSRNNGYSSSPNGIPQSSPVSPSNTYDGPPARNPNSLGDRYNFDQGNQNNGPVRPDVRGTTNVFQSGNLNRLSSSENYASNNIRQNSEQGPSSNAQVNQGFQSNAQGSQRFPTNVHGGQGSSAFPSNIQESQGFSSNVQGSQGFPNEFSPSNSFTNNGEFAGASQSFNEGFNSVGHQNNFGGGLSSTPSTTYNGPSNSRRLNQGAVQPGSSGGLFRGESADNRENSFNNGQLSQQSRNVNGRFQEGGSLNNGFDTRSQSTQGISQVSNFNANPQNAAFPQRRSQTSNGGNQDIFGVSQIVRASGGKFEGAPAGSSRQQSSRDNSGFPESINRQQQQQGDFRATNQGSHNSGTGAGSFNNRVQGQGSRGSFGSSNRGFAEESSVFPGHSVNPQSNNRESHGNLNGASAASYPPSVNRDQSFGSPRPGNGIHTSTGSQVNQDRYNQPTRTQLQNPVSQEYNGPFRGGGERIPEVGFQGPNSRLGGENANGNIQGGFNTFTGNNRHGSRPFDDSREITGAGYGK